MKNSTSKRKSLRRQWSVDVPSSIQKKFREVTQFRRSKSLDDEVYKQKLLTDESQFDRHDNKQRTKGSFENFGQDRSELPHSSCSSGSSPWYSFDDDNSEGSFREYEPQNQTDIDEIDIDVRNCENFEKASLSMRTKDILSVNMCGSLSTIEELSPRSPTKRTSPAAELNTNEHKTGITGVPIKFAKGEGPRNICEEPELGERYRRYAICEEMERYIICDHKGLSLRKYRETLIRHRVLKELCLLWKKHYSMAFTFLTS